MSSPFALKFLGKKPFTKKTVNPEAGGKDYEAMGDAARKREQKLSAEAGGVDYEARLKVQEKMSPLNGAYSSGGGGFVYKPIAGDIRDFYNKVSAGIQARIANEKAKKSKFNPDGSIKNEFSSKYTPKKEESTYEFKNNVGLSDVEKSNKENLYYKGQSNKENLYQKYQR